MAVMNTEAGRPPGRRGRYPKEFRRDAAALVLDQRRTIVDVARELGVVEQTLGNWVRQERIDRGEKEGTTSDLRAENARLNRENKQLRLERDLLKKATAFWVKESDRGPTTVGLAPGRPKDSPFDCAVRSPSVRPRVTTTGARRTGLGLHRPSSTRPTWSTRSWPSTPPSTTPTDPLD